MEQLAKNRLSSHTHVFSSEEGIIIAKTKQETLDWIKFWWFYEIGDEYVLSAMPEIEVYYDIKLTPEDE